MKIKNFDFCRVKLVFCRTLYSQSAASLTMGSLAAQLRAMGIKTDLCLLDIKAIDSPENILGNHCGKNLVIAKPNFKDFQSMLPLLERLKRFGLIQRVFFCGPFAKRNSHGLMSSLAWLDGVIVDQIEASVSTLISSMSEDLTSWDFKSPGVISRNTSTGDVESYNPLKDSIPLDEIPFPARDIEKNESHSFVNIEASRGCLFNCSFCHVPFTFSSKSVIDVRNPVLVVDEIEKLNREMGKTLFIFNDSCFWSTQKDDSRILIFCEEIAKRNLDVHFYIYLKGEPFIGDEIIQALVKAGLVRVFLGVENSVKSSLATYRKNIRPDLYETVKAKLDPFGVNIHIGYITIEPHSSLDNVLSNVEYLFKIGKLFRLGVILEPVRVVPGTSLHQQLVKEGLILPNLDYGEITYGYKFAHDDVGLLLSGWKKMLGDDLRTITYGFEYYSTTGELLRILAERIDRKFIEILKNHYDKFNEKKMHGMLVLLEYLKTSIELARNGNSHLVSSSSYNRDFLSKFTEITQDLAVMYNNIVSVVNQNGGGRAVKEIYTS